MTAKPIGSYRWRIVALLFFATVINYIDRNVLSFTMIDENFKKEMLGLPVDQPLTAAANATFKEQMGYVDSAFKLMYALGFLLIGWLIDKIGTKKGYSLGIFVWSVAGVLTAFIGSIGQLRFARGLLGLGEASNFPAAIKTVSEWFPKKERSLANGIFNAGTNVGVILTALTIPALTLAFGWRASFLITGALGFILLVFWWFLYSRPEENKKLSPEELAYIHSDPAEIMPDRIPWIKMLSYRQTWALMVGKFMADPIWWFYLTWLPDFFNSNDALDQKLDLKTIGVPFLIIYLVSDVGSVFFGWVSSKFMQMGWSLNKARKVTMLICAVCVVPIFFASLTNSVYVAVAIISLAASAHQGWSANLYTFGSDLFPKSMVASATGIGGMAGAIGGTLFAAASGLIIARFGYVPLFTIASVAYLLALGIIQLILPRLEPVKR
ncbi:MFS transporter [Rhabdobacter roseus]|uniref:ACS family hexuronate transporter-like MFS transporter n=1 Tax=Rhabdobacter roseus TaxID=1655419 RepID=A0A840TKE7_9BACT|nr:MFS transporter [Rhabdobacter roseus]MBB5282032.1 ACS family hexuronate transporter-like MFS transporter [Rhabdobacter roseus]